MKKKNFLVFCVICLGFVVDGIAQYYFPVGEILPGDYRDADDFASSYGPRNKGGTLASPNDWPSIAYDYDFHGGVDIHAPVGWRVFSVDDGVVQDYSDDWIDIRSWYYEEGTTNKIYFWVRYFHIDRNTALTRGQTVDAGDEIAKIAVYPGGNPHLDIRYIESYDIDDYNWHSVPDVGI